MVVRLAKSPLARRNNGESMIEEQYNNYINILNSELLPAMGCTEPIAIAFAAAKARAILRLMPDKMKVYCSGNIIKNVKSVIVPNSGGQRGIEAAAVLGMVAGNEELGLQVISEVKPDDIELTKKLIANKICECFLAEGEENLYVSVEVFKKNESVCVELRKKHDHISKITRNKEVIFEQPTISVKENGDKSKLNIKDIIEFANSVELNKVEAIIDRQIQCNSNISNEGLSNLWGAAVGKTIAEIDGNTICGQARAAAAAGSDARMNGCALPVVINSGSGNQGITCSMPIIVYAKELKVHHEKLIRALLLANLISIHQKRFIGNLSAYCGAVSAGTAAACGIAYLQDADYDVIGRTIINGLGNVGGIVCDGAKSSCAAKIASAVEAGIMGYEMAKRGRCYQFGEGIIEGDYEQVIRNLGHIGKVGMKQTDVAIINMMLGRENRG